MSVRRAIRTLLIDGVQAVQVPLVPGPGIDYAASRVLEPHGARIDTEKPFIIVRHGPEGEQQDWSGPVIRFEVWPMLSRTSFITLDEVVAQIGAALEDRRFDAGVAPNVTNHYALKLSEGVDTLERDFDAITRQINFEVWNLDWLLQETYDPDPLAALRAWTEAKWPPLGNPPVAQVQTDPATWEPSSTAPGIYWRLVGIPRVVEQWATVSWVEQRIAGHILTPDKQNRLAWTRRLTEALSVQRRLILQDPLPPGAPVGAVPARHPMDFMAVAGDSSAHPMRQGQVLLTVRYGVLHEEAVVSPLIHATVSGDVEEQEV